MSAAVLLTHEQVEKTHAWVRAFYEAYDSSDLQGWIAEFYQPDAVVRLGNLQPLKGHDEILAYFERQRAQLSSMTHVVGHIGVLPERVYVHCEITSIVKNDPEKKEINIRGLAVFGKKVDEEKMSFYDVHSDPSPILERIKMYA